jgi:hypothetical protein
MTLFYFLSDSVPSRGYRILVECRSFDRALCFQPETGVCSEAGRWWCYRPTPKPPSSLLSWLPCPPIHPQSKLMGRECHNRVRLRKRQGGCAIECGEQAPPCCSSCCCCCCWWWWWWWWWILRTAGMQARIQGMDRSLVALRIMDSAAAAFARSPSPLPFCSHTRMRCPACLSEMLDLMLTNCTQPLPL